MSLHISCGHTGAGCEAPGHAGRPAPELKLWQKQEVNQKSMAGNVWRKKPAPGNVSANTSQPSLKFCFLGTSPSPVEMEKKMTFIWDSFSSSLPRFLSPFLFSFPVSMGLLPPSVNLDRGSQWLQSQKVA